MHLTYSIDHFLHRKKLFLALAVWCAEGLKTPVLRGLFWILAAIFGSAARSPFVLSVRSTDCYIIFQDLPVILSVVIVLPDHQLVVWIWIIHVIWMHVASFNQFHAFMFPVACYEWLVRRHANARDLWKACDDTLKRSGFRYCRCCRMESPSATTSRWVPPCRLIAILSSDCHRVVWLPSCCLTATLSCDCHPGHPGNSLTDFHLELRLAACRDLAWYRLVCSTTIRFIVDETSFIDDCSVRR